MKIYTRSVSESFDFSGVDPDFDDADNAEIGDEVRRIHTAEIAADLVEIGKLKTFKWLRLCDNEDTSGKGYTKWNHGFYSVTQENPNYILILGRGTQSAYGFEVIGQNTLKFIDVLGQPNLEGDYRIHIDPFILTIIRQGKYQITSLEVGQFEPNPSWYDSKVQWSQIKPTLSLSERGCGGIVFDFTGNMLRYNKKHPTQITLTLADCQALAKIKLPVSPVTFPHYQFIRGWVFESSAAAETFFGWLREYGYTTPYIGIREYDQRRQFDMRKWRDVEHSYNPEGGWFIEGKERPKKKRSRQLPRAKDIIIESFDFQGEMCDDADDVDDTVTLLENMRLGDIAQKWQSVQGSAECEVSDGVLTITHASNSKIKVRDCAEPVTLRFDNGVLRIEENLQSNMTIIPTKDAGIYIPAATIRGMQIMLWLLGQMQENIDLTLNISAESQQPVMINPGGFSGDMELDLSEADANALESKLLRITLHVNCGNDVYCSMRKYSTAGNLFETYADFMMWFANNGLTFECLGNRHMFRNGRNWLLDSSKCDEHGVSAEIKNSVESILRRKYKWKNN